MGLLHVISVLGPEAWPCAWPWKLSLCLQQLLVLMAVWRHPSGKLHFLLARVMGSDTQLCLLRARVVWYISDELWDKGRPVR